MNDFNGLVKAKQESVSKALLNYDKAKKEAKEIYKLVQEKASVDTVVHNTWFGLAKKTITIEQKCIIDSDDLWESYEYQYPKHYPEITREHLILVGATGEGHVAAMFKHNPEEMYLSPEQAAWVSRWEVRN